MTRVRLFDVLKKKLPYFVHELFEFLTRRVVMIALMTIPPRVSLSASSYYSCTEYSIALHTDDCMVERNMADAINPERMFCSWTLLHYLPQVVIRVGSTDVLTGITIDTTSYQSRNSSRHYMHVFSREI
jgi:hypothetical protein